MEITQIKIEQNVKDLIHNFSKDDFIFDLLLAYGEPKSTISRLKSSDLNHLNSKGELTHRKKLLFKIVDDAIHKTMDEVKVTINSLKQKPRFIILTDFESFLCFDTKTNETLDILIKELPKNYDFLIALNKKLDKEKIIDENPADVRASNKLAKLYDEILKDNPTDTQEEVHALNIFLTRLLFCYFAEDSNIFKENIFTNSISSHTLDDGSDLNSYLTRVFEILDIKEVDRDINLPKYLNDFHYVNGGLFTDKIPLPHFSKKSRNIILEIGGLDWSAINPDIFGSMIQAVVTPEHRGDMGMHYTSVPNIMKLIKPLFLDELYETYEKSQKSKKKLQELLIRISKLKIFDPACGSGNFLIIAYKELRTLEMQILKSIDDLSSQKSFAFSEITLTQFYGIELDDFAHEVAILSLWLTEHQMNLEFYKIFGRTSPSLPLQDGGNIVHGNATRLDWEVVCPKVDGDEIYVLGNPPYLGAKLQNKEQKEDKLIAFDNKKGINNLDYIASWFYKGAKYIKDINAKYAFVSTNSICQGEQVSILWKHIFKDNIEINFAYKSFKWQNNAKANAGVSVAIIGLRNKINKPKFIYQNNLKQEVKNINAYLVNSINTFVTKRTKTLSFSSKMEYGNMAIDGGFLILSPSEKKELINKHPFVSKIIKQLYGAQEFLNGVERYCLWIQDKYLEEALKIPIINERINSVKEKRLSIKDKGSQELAKKPHQFREMKEGKYTSLLIPTVSSEKRKYLPIGFIDTKKVIIAPNQVIYDGNPYMMGVLSSHFHMVWIRAVAGRLEERYRYSSTVVYNTFPFPNITNKQKEEITELVFNIIEEREEHSEKTLAQLYDPDKMPLELKDAHHQLDLAIERCYRNKPFKNDEERLEYLFRLYEEMVESEGK